MLNRPSPSGIQVSTSQTSSPFSALTAMSRPSNVPTKTFPSYTATPLLWAGPQQAKRM